MRIVNLTAHQITVRLPSGGDRTFPPSGKIARCQPVSAPVAEVDGVPVVQSSFGNLEGLPEPEDGTFFLVSTPAAQKAAEIGRADVIAPDTGPTAIRKDGQIVAVIRFQRF